MTSAASSTTTARTRRDRRKNPGRLMQLARGFRGSYRYETVWEYDGNGIASDRSCKFNRREWTSTIIANRSQSQTVPDLPADMRRSRNYRTKPKSSCTGSAGVWVVREITKRSQSQAVPDLPAGPPTRNYETKPKSSCTGSAGKCVASEITKRSQSENEPARVAIATSLGLRFSKGSVLWRLVALHHQETGTCPYEGSGGSRCPYQPEA